MRPSPHEREHEERPRLQVVRPPPASRRRVPFAIACFLLVGSLVTCVVVLQALVSQGSFRAGDLQRKTARLQAENRELRLEVAGLSAPERIAREARRLGLVLPQRVEVVTVPGWGPGSR